MTPPDAASATSHIASPASEDTVAMDTAPRPGDAPRDGLPSRRIGAVVAGRYRIEAQIGRGGSGYVDRALDLHTGERVAIKWISDDTARGAWVRREVTSLRLLPVPGVVSHRGDGVGVFGPYLVLDLVDGDPFPGPGAPMDWPTLRPRVIALLRVLRSIHALRIVHGDLKPANVLVDVSGAVTLLDFGTTAGDALPRAVPAATLGYAPEDWRLPGGIDARADLFAVAVMVTEVLTGLRPGPGAAPPYPSDPSLAGLLRRMLAADRDHRPPDVHAVLAALGETDGSRAVGGFATRRAMHRLFGGPQAFLHEPSRAAAVLWSRTSGAPARVREELDRWVGAGVAWWEGEKLRIRDGALTELDLEAAGTPASPALGLHSELAAAAALRRGDLPACTLAAGRGLDEADRTADLALGRRCAGLLVKAALAAEARPPVSRALALLGKRPRAEDTAPLEDLLAAYEAFLSGTHAEAEARLATVPPFEDHDLDAWRVALLVRMARRSGDERARLESFAGWATTPVRQARWLGWHGNLLYREGAYAAAARCHAESLRLRRTADGRLSALRSLAIALLELPDLESAARTARRARRLAHRVGHPGYEAYAVQLERAARYRLGDPLRPRPELASAAARVDPLYGALTAFTEAAIAWRRGRVATGAALARAAGLAFSALGQRDHASLARALAAACGDSGGDIRAIVASAQSVRLPEIAMQILALARIASLDPDPAWTSQAQVLSTSVSPTRLACRLDVLSVEEACDPCWRLLVRRRAETLR